MDCDHLCLSLTRVSLVPQPWIQGVLKGTFFLVSRMEFSTQETENSPGKPHALAIPAVAASYSFFIPPRVLSLILTTVTTVLTSTWGFLQPVASPSISFLFSLLPNLSPPPFPILFLFDLLLLSDSVCACMHWLLRCYWGEIRPPGTWKKCEQR